MRTREGAPNALRAARRYAPPSRKHNGGGMDTSSMPRMSGQPGSASYLERVSRRVDVDVIA
jgi:hypothetical protein